MKSVDARPSDVLNLALLAGAPIKVEPALLAATDRSPRLGSLETWYGEATQGSSDIAAEIAEHWSSPGSAAGQPGR